MDAQELRQLGLEEIKAKVRQWKDEAFRLKFRAETSEIKDTSSFLKLRRNVARALTILKEKDLGISVAPKAKVEVPTETAPQDKPVKKAARKSTKSKE